MWFSNRVRSAQPEEGKLFYYSNLLKKMVAVRKSVSDTKFAAFNPDYVFYITYLDIKRL
jgi:hypothetical protein